MELHRLMVFSIHITVKMLLLRMSVCQWRLLVFVCWQKCATNYWHANIAYILYARAEGSQNFVASTAIPTRGVFEYNLFI